MTMPAADTTAYDTVSSACNRDDIDTVDLSGFCLLTDSIPDILVEMRYYSDYNFVGSRIDGYEEPVAILTQKAASALRKVSDDLRAQGFQLKIYDAYRPQRAVKHFLQWSKEPSDTMMKSVFYPGIHKSTIFSRGFVARKSGHSRGSTVDLTLVYAATGEEVDMGGPFDFFGERSHTFSEQITEQQRQNRLLLRNAMLRRGFRPVQGEWWHFTLRNEPFPDTYFDFPVSKRHFQGGQ
ncbi:MAG: M15 family metallopeptidase [Bacteroidales bacterium]|nr:M15 family metallopeptidase [Bacteroidales bacterium]